MGHPSQARHWVSLTPKDADRLAEWHAMRARAEAVMSDYQWRVNGSVTRVYDSLVAWDFKNCDSEWGQVQAKFLAEDLETMASEAVRVSLRKSRVEFSLKAMNKGRFVRETVEVMNAPHAEGGLRHGHGAGEESAVPIIVPPSEGSTTTTGASTHEPSSAASGGDEGALDFILVAGDDVTDEEMFTAMNAWTEEKPAERVPGCTAPGRDERDGRHRCAVFTLHVGRSEKRTRAHYCLPDVAAMQRLLVELSKA